MKLQEEFYEQFDKIADTSFQIQHSHRTMLKLSSFAQTDNAKGSLILAVQCPFTLRSALAIATGRASKFLMRPAVERHHRSSRALTQDAPTLRDLLIFEIARPGMFI